jgi:hypothetical protein
MIKIEIESAEVKTKSGVSARTGKPYSMREQKGYVYTCDRDGKPNRHPNTLVLTLREDQQPYAAGFYTLSPASFYTNKYDQLEVSPVLVAVPVAAVKAAA